MVGIQVGDAVETKKKPTRKGKVKESTDCLTWSVEFKDEHGESYFDILKSSQLKKISLPTSTEATAVPKKTRFNQAIKRAVNAITPKKKKKPTPSNRREPSSTAAGTRAARRILEGSPKTRIECDGDGFEAVYGEDDDGSNDDDDDDDGYSDMSSLSSIKSIRKRRNGKHGNMKVDDSFSTPGGNNSKGSSCKDNSRNNDDETPTSLHSDSSSNLNESNPANNQDSLQPSSVAEDDQGNDDDDDDPDQDQDDGFPSLHDNNNDYDSSDDEEEEKDLLSDSSSLGSFLNEEHFTEDPTGEWVSNLEPAERFQWKKRLYEREKAELLAKKWSIKVIPSESGCKISVGSLVIRKKKPQLEGEVIEKVGKKWKVRTDAVIQTCPYLGVAVFTSCAHLFLLFLYIS